MQFLIQTKLSSLEKTRSLLNELETSLGLVTIEDKEGGYRIKGENANGSCRYISSSEMQGNYSLRLKTESATTARQLEELLGLPLETSPVILSLIEFAQQINRGKKPKAIAEMARWDSNQLEKYITEIQKAAKRKGTSADIVSAATLLGELDE